MHGYIKAHISWINYIFLNQKFNIKTNIDVINVLNVMPWMSKDLNLCFTKHGMPWVIFGIQGLFEKDNFRCKLGLHGSLQLLSWRKACNLQDFNPFLSTFFYSLSFSK
jgi:hypothetical protein